ncbi:hypothetical protein JCM33374_g1300 [Metschnikowia sp. JCM 33374]|nr:hypothetical protein JCM33374_g1300 [Metschnikowia sp. JCM 33374]
MLGILVAFTTLLSAALADLQGCQPNKILGNGFNVDFYHYPQGNTAFNDDPNYYSTGYKQFGYLGSITGVKRVFFRSNAPTRKVTKGQIYGYGITTSNFSMAIGGYFLAPQTGDYHFNMYGDDGAFLQFGAGSSCCGNALDDVAGASFKAAWPNNADTVFTLEKGIYYPVKIVVVNWDGPGGFNLGYTAPDGTFVDDLAGNVYQIRQVCTTTATATWTGSGTQTVTRTGDQSVTEVVQVPSPTQTQTGYWTGTDTSISTITGGPGKTNTLVVNLPATRTTSYWNSPYASTSIVSPGDGGEPTVIVLEPFSTTTTTTYWSNTYASTTTVPPANGGQATVIVEKPSQGFLKGCEPSKILGNGFNVDFYRYPQGDTTFNDDPNYYSTGYKQFGYLGSITGVKRVFYRSNAPTRTVTKGQIYGYGITTTNFSMAIGGYFLAPQTGDYHFNMYGDDGAFLQFGAGSSCCGNALDDVAGASFKAAWPNNADTVFTLEKGIYYPVKIVVVNWDGPGGFNLGYTAPDGTSVDDLAGNVYQIRQVCTTTATATWTGTGTETVTQTGDESVTVVVDVPSPTQTQTAYWTGTDTSISTITGGPGKTNTLVVNLPATRTTSYWNSPYASTSIVSPGDGGEPTVIVFDPTSTTATIPSVTSSWTGSYTTTETVTGADGSKSPIAVVPGAPAVTSSWTGSYTTTETVTGADGSKSPIAVVPGAPAVTSSWTGSYTTTETVTGADGSKSPIAVVPGVPAALLQILDWILHYH